MSQELYKAYRPEDFDEIVGNKTTIKSIKKALESDNFPHLVLLSGPSGCGKTTIGRIIKKHFNCADIDYKEINCGERGTVGDARDIVKEMRFGGIQSKCKIYLMDECHMLTLSALNAYLKPFEDTPEHVYFIMCTTEPDKILGTMKTRCTHWKVDKLSEDETCQLLEEVIECEKMVVPEEVVKSIAEASDGSSRKALVLLQQMEGLDPSEMKEQIYSFVEEGSDTFQILKCLMWEKNWGKLKVILKNTKEDPERVRRALLTMCQNQLLGDKSNNWQQAWKCIDCLSEPFYNTGKPGLVAACYEILFGD